MLGILATPFTSSAAIKTEVVQYKHGDATLEGFLAYDDSIKQAPGILVVHEWMGLGDYVKDRAKQFAKMGYVAFAADLYGKGVRPKDQKEAGEFAGKYKANRPLLRARTQAGLDTLKKNSHVNPNKLIALGYCFGGTAALELARSGAPLMATVTFHGGLDTPTPQDAKNIKGRVLVLAGGSDPYVPAEQVAAFQDEMKKANVDWQMNQYGGAVHSFTVPTAGNDPSKGAAYNAVADRRSFEDFKVFLSELK
ncbi:MAG: dienelactone hydrolase family protein [Methylotenera sp.]|nr:dienelactone hydrolase family protein [Oligoflexia bacterium]